jgi:hypothetical protein
LSYRQFNAEGAALCTEYLVYVIAAKGDSNGIGGLSFGIEYNGNPRMGVEVLDWISCADWTWTDAGRRGYFPESGGGIVVMWVENCQLESVGTDGVHAVAGALHIYAHDADYLKMTPNRTLLSGPEAVYVDCLYRETPIDTTMSLGWAGFGGLPGCHWPPCFIDFSPASQPAGCPNPVETSTWGSIKALYR